ncbi:hypothetical protein [Comamonas testosteroni]|uniref:hypothetical protein n=1 Tax=Comamonas testosteroni TaxID=285 RepID=UPI00128F14DA|nr:hypothetical protein [Comamonas testosteroni]
MKYAKLALLHYLPIMRIYLMLRGKRTTISVDDQLIGYLADRECSSSLDRVIGWRQTTRKWIQKSIDGAGDALPSKNISQWVQALIIDAIVDPALLKKRKEAALTGDGHHFSGSSGKNPSLSGLSSHELNR